MKQATENDYYYRKNLFGDVLAIYDTNGTVVAEYLYDAWGRVLSATDKTNLVIAEINPFRYRSYYYDTETELYYLETRYYDPKLGRFLNPDTLDYLGDGEDLANYNLFAYCGNNPVMYIDPTGHAISAAIIIGAIVGAVIGFGATVYADYRDDGKVFNGSIGVGGYFANTFVGGVIGGFIGGFGTSTFTFAIPKLAFVKTTIGTTIPVVGTASVAVSGVTILTGAAVAGSLILAMRIGKSGGYRIDHHYPNDHDPTHVHISGDDGETSVDLNGNPIQNKRPMTPGERKAFWRLFDKIVEALTPWT